MIRLVIRLVLTIVVLFIFDENGAITLGNITYSNSGLTVEKEYKLFIPVTVKYTFGSVFTTVELTITPTYDKK